MRRITAIILLISLHLQPLWQVNAWVDYMVNSDYIATVLCINKEKIELKCDGKCYLAQQLKKQKSQQEQELPQLIHVKLEFILPQHLEDKQPYTLTSIDKIVSVPNNYTYQYHSKLLQPPRL